MACYNNQGGAQPNATPPPEEDYYNDEIYDSYTSSSGSSAPTTIPDTLAWRMATEPFVTDKMIPFRVMMRNKMRKRINEANRSPTFKFCNREDGLLISTKFTPSRQNRGYGRDTPAMRPRRLNFDAVSPDRERINPFIREPEYEDETENVTPRFQLSADIGRRISNLNMIAMSPIVSCDSVRGGLMLNVAANPASRTRSTRDNQARTSQRLDFNRT